MRSEMSRSVVHARENTMSVSGLRQGAVERAPGEAGVLAVRNISKHFGGTQALDDVSLEVDGGAVLALLGENGAGKSTLIKILAGVHSPDAGQIIYRGEPTSAAKLPIAFIHQDLGLIEWMTVAENICLVLGYPRRMGFIHLGDMRKKATRVLHPLGVDIDPDTRIEDFDPNREGFGCGGPNAGF